MSAAIQKTADDAVKIFAYPGYLIGSEISKLVNKGYQQFLKTSKTEVPATAEHLKALQTVFGRAERRPGPAQPLQRIARHRRAMPINMTAQNRDKPPGSSQAPLGSRRQRGSGKAVAAKKGRA